MPPTHAFLWKQLSGKLKRRRPIEEIRLYMDDLLTRVVNAEANARSAIEEARKFFTTINVVKDDVLRLTKTVEGLRPLIASATTSDKQVTLEALILDRLFKDGAIIEVAHIGGSYQQFCRMVDVPYSTARDLLHSPKRLHERRWYPKNEAHTGKGWAPWQPVTRQEMAHGDLAFLCTQEVSGCVMLLHSTTAESAPEQRWPRRTSQASATLPG